MPSSRSAAPVVVTVLIALCLTGCRASNSPTTGAGQPAAGQPAVGTSPSAQAPSTAPPATGPALATLPAACPTAAEVSTALGISAATPAQTATSTTLDCAYAGSGTDSVSINFTTAKKLTPASAEAALKAQGSSARFQAVGGLGDAAFYDSPPTGGSYIVVLSGGLAFHVVLGSVVAPDKFAALARSILAG